MKRRNRRRRLFLMLPTLPDRASLSSERFFQNTLESENLNAILFKAKSTKKHFDRNAQSGQFAFKESSDEHQSTLLEAA